jgi:hypothetical protein
VVGIPVAIAVSFVMLLSIPVGLILLFGYLILFVLATSISSVVIANWLNNVYFKGKWKYIKLSFASFFVFVVLKLFSLTPFVGFPITVLVVCMAWGAILLNIKWKRQQTISTSA